MIRRLRLARYGETGFCCTHCGCTHGFEVKDRPRVQRCQQCKRQQSVTAGTPMHGSKVSLRAWFVRGGHFEAGSVPTSGQLRAEVKMARSSAWHVNQRFMRATFLGRASYILGQLTMMFPCRRPKGRDTDETRPRLHQDLLRNFALSPKGQKRMTMTAITFDGAQPRFTHVAMDHEQHHEARKDPPFQPPTVTGLLEQWLRYHIEKRHDTVCLRWLSRYLDHYLGIYAHLSNWSPRPDWKHLLTHQPRRRASELRAEPVSPEPERPDRCPTRVVDRALMQPEGVGAPTVPG
ncbi:MAG: hypothetical protein H6735_29875 [Alphaproteobacteria bacterium]|nr:hypothetical protein [Alphaproteobacteria bacterium]